MCKCKHSNDYTIEENFINNGLLFLFVSFVERCRSKCFLVTSDIVICRLLFYWFCLSWGNVSNWWGFLFVLLCGSVCLPAPLSLIVSSPPPPPQLPGCGGRHTLIMAGFLCWVSREVKTYFYTFSRSNKKRLHASPQCCQQLVFPNFANPASFVHPSSWNNENGVCHD